MGLLRDVSQHQSSLLRDAIGALDLPGGIALARRGAVARIAGFLALRSPCAAEIQRQLALRGVLRDVRGHMFRLGPAVLSDVARGLA